MDRRTWLAELLEERRSRGRRVRLPDICFVGRDTPDGPWMCQHTRWENGLPVDDGEPHEHDTCPMRQSSGLLAETTSATEESI